VEVGRLDGNPLAEDLEEAAALLPVAATAQTVLDGEGRLVALCCGPLRRAHREACRAAAARFAVPLAARGDLVLADAGPARNWVQSHKALVNAERAAAPGGVIILHAPCPEGLGSASLRHWLERGTPAAILASLPGRADINAQTALSTLLRGRRAILVAPGAPADLALAGMPVAEDLRQALLLARERLPAAALAQPRVVRLPQAWLTVPCPPDLPLPAVAVK
jgi:nickel-dependent lactate racemase